MAGSSRGGISFEDVPADLIASVEVTKVPTADQVEGSVGGLINLRLYHGLDLRKAIRAAQFDAEYAELAGKWK